MKNNQDVCEYDFAKVRKIFFSHDAPTDTEAMGAMVKSIFIRMENIQKSNYGMMKETDYNTTQMINRKQSSSVGVTTSQKKQRSAKDKVLRLVWKRVKV